MNAQSKAKLIEAWVEILCLEDIAQDMLDAVAENLPPEDVFNHEQLAEWAENNGYVKSESD